MLRWARWSGWGGWALILALMGCTLQNQARPAYSARVLHTDLTARLAEVRGADENALALWDRIIFGEVVSCQETIPVPVPVMLTENVQTAYPQAGLIQAELNAAIQAVRNSADLWNIECADGRAVVPLNMAREGRATALAAGAPLDQAEALLAAWIVE